MGWLTSTASYLGGIFRPAAPRFGTSQFRSEVFAAPFRGPNDLDSYGNETPQMRRAYLDLYRKEPTVAAAVNGKAEAIACLDVSVIPEDKKNPQDIEDAEFVKYCLDHCETGPEELIRSVLVPGYLTGYSVGEIVLEPRPTRRWGLRWPLRHVRSLDTSRVRLQLDVFRTVTGVVNTVAGLETFDPAKFVIHSRRPLFHNPFGGADLRGVYRAAALLSDAYQLWYIALKAYSTPYMHAKANDSRNIKLLENAMVALRASGYAVTSAEDTIEVLNLAAAASYEAFEAKVRIMREEIYLAVRGAYLPFLQGQGQGDSRGNTETHKVASDSSEQFDAKAVGVALTRSLVPPLLAANFPGPRSVPRVVLGGTDWQETRQQLEAIKLTSELVPVSRNYIHDITSIPPPDGPDDAVGGPQPPPGMPGAPGMPGGPGGAPGGSPPGGPQPNGPPPQPPAQPAPPAPPERMAADPPAAPDPTPDGPAGDVFRVPPSAVALDPARFQFRRGADPETGAARPLPEERFDPERSDPLLVWRDPADGKDYAVDGHHRRAWAERDGAAWVPVRYVRAADAAAAREVGRRANEAARFSAGRGRDWDEDAVDRDRRGRFREPNTHTFSDADVGAAVAELLAEFAGG